MGIVALQSKSEADVGSLRARKHVQRDLHKAA